MDKEIVQQNDLFYEINKDNLTAVVVNSPNSVGDVLIPTFIEHDLKKIKIIGLKEESFKANDKIRRIIMPKESYLQFISKKSFSNSSIKTLTIPSTVDKLEDGWCSNTSQLKTVTISPLSKHFKYLDEKQQIIIGKSNVNEEIFDTIIFASRNIERAIIPNYIKYIKPYAFEYCHKLKSIEISEDSNLFSIGKKAFFGSSIKTLFIPPKVRELEDGWLNDIIQLKKVTISPSSKHFKYLDEEHQIIVGKSDINEENFDTIIFANRNIERATIPNYIKYIKPYSFEYCKILNGIEISENSKLISLGKEIFSCSSVKHFFIPASVEIIEDGWCNYASKLKTVAISPSSKHFKYLDEAHQIIVGKSDMNEENFDTIIFANRNIERATIPNYIKYIKPYAFANCHKLKSIEISEDSELLEIGKNAFEYAALKSIIIPKSVIKIHKYAFSSCGKLESFSLEEGSKLESIENSLLFFCSHLCTLQIPENSSLQKICRDALYNTSIQNFFIPESVKVLEDEWYSGSSSLKTVAISPLSKHFKYLDEEHQIIIGKSVPNEENFDTVIFANRNIEHVIIPNYIEYIKPFAFEKCKKLKTIEFQNDSKISYINKEILHGASINSIFIPASVKILEDEWSNETRELNTVTISPLNKNFKYLDEEHQIIIGKSVPNEENFDTIIFASRNIEQVIIPNYIKYIKPFAFENCRKLKTVEIQKDSKLVSIGKDAFYNSSVRDIAIPKSVTSIKDSAFSFCEQLQNVSFEDGSKLHSFKDGVFQLAYELETIEIPENSSLQTIYSGAFCSCGIKKIFIPASVKELDDNWCNGAMQLRNVKVSPSNKHFKYLDEEHQIIVGKSDLNLEIFDTIIFANRSIERATIPNYIKYIKPQAFKNCMALKTIEIHDNSEIESIGLDAFSSTSLIYFKVPKKIHFYDHFLCNNQELRYFEFLGDYFIDNESSIFNEFKSTILASFPNVKELNIHLNSISLHQKLMLLVSANVKITFLSDNDDDDNSSDDDNYLFNFF